MALIVSDLRTGDRFRSGFGVLYSVVTVTPGLSDDTTLLTLETPELGGRPLTVPYLSEDSLGSLGWTLEDGVQWQYSATGEPLPGGPRGVGLSRADSPAPKGRW